MSNLTERSLNIVNGWRIAGWGSLLALLLLPVLAMRFTTEVNWTGSDFVFAAILLLFVGGVVELSVRLARSGARRTGFLIAGVTAFLTVWSNAAVGIIGDDNRVNSLFFLMVIIGLAAALLVRCRPGLMRWIAMAIGLGQYGVGLAALTLMPGHQVEWGILTVFAILWFAAAWCFHRGRY